MNQAFAFNQSNNKTKALELFLIVGENTELQRHETERQVYVCSQTMACMCYNSLKNIRTDICWQKTSSRATKRQ